jgi:hypothetical protein
VNVFSNESARAAQAKSTSNVSRRKSG